MSADLPAPSYRALIDLALAEDLGCDKPTSDADITSAWVVDPGTAAKATIVAKQEGVLAGLEIARLVFARLDPSIAFHPLKAEGDLLADGETLVELEGPAQAILAGERTALNFLQRLSGIATLTRAYVNAVAGTKARITDTRKTTPGYRQLEKYAVGLGGGTNHRMGLYDAVLIKENHAAAAGGVEAAIKRAKQRSRTQIPILVETRSITEVERALAAGPDRIMLDNMSPEEMEQATGLIRRTDAGIEIEATGGITLENVARVGATGVDLVSVGALTHSAAALDLSLLFSTAS